MAEVTYRRGDRDNRPWGRWEVLDTGEGFAVKRITVNPGAILSLQLHHHREEHWVVVRGRARVTRGSEVHRARPQSKPCSSRSRPRTGSRIRATSRSNSSRSRSATSWTRTTSSASRTATAEADRFAATGLPWCAPVPLGLAPRVAHPYLARDTGITAVTSAAMQWFGDSEVAALRGRWMFGRLWPLLFVAAMLLAEVGRWRRGCPRRAIRSISS